MVVYCGIHKGSRMTNEQKIEFAKKLFALAQFGIEGEKNNAQRMLEDFLQKHNLDLEELQDSKIELCTFDVEEKHEALFSQIVYSWFNDVQILVPQDKRKKKQLIVKMTPLDALELKIKFEFYRDLLDKEYNIFYNAFVQKNKILPPTAKSTDWGSLSEEEKEFNKRVNKMQEQIERRDFVKQLNK